MHAFEGDGPLGCAALELLPKALALLQAAGDGGDAAGTAGDADNSSERWSELAAGAANDAATGMRKRDSCRL